MNKIDEILAQIALLNEKLDRLSSVSSSVPFVDSGYTLFSWLREWLEREHRQKVNYETYKKDSGVLRKHVFSKSEYDFPLVDFKLKDLESLVCSVESSRQRQITATLLSAALKFAFYNDILPKNIVSNFKKPRHTYKEDRALTTAEEQRLLRVVKGHFLETYVKVVLYSGLRRNEALGLLRRNIDFDNNEIHVEQQSTITGALTTKLKTLSSKRTIKMFPELKAALIQFDWCAPDVRLFDFKPRYVTRKFTDLCIEHNIPDFTIKSLRTTFATRCDERGIPSNIISAWLGHTTLKTTKTHYLKLNPDYVESEFLKAVERSNKT